MLFCFNKSLNKKISIAIILFIWAISFIIASPCFGNESILNLSTEEKAWIKENHTVRVRIGNAPPFMLTKGKIQGIAIDYLAHIFEINGIKIKYIVDSEITWPEALEYIKRHEVVDMVPTAKITEKRKKDMIFTDEYIFAPWVIFTSSDADFISSIDDLKGRTVSVEEGFVMHHVLKQNYPEIKLKVASSSLENFTQIPVKDLSTGVVDAYIGNLLSTTYTIQAKGYSNVKVAAPTPFDNHNQAMAIRNDWPELAGIINKTLTSMTPEDHAAIRNKWLSIRYEYGIDKLHVLKWVLGVIVIALFIIGFVLIWNKRLKTEVLHRVKIEKKLKDSEKRLQSFLANSPVGIGIWDKEFKYIYINEILQKLNGPSLKEHIGKTIEEVLPNAAPIIRPIFEKILSTGNAEIGIELSGEVPSKPGKITHYMLSYFPITDGTETIEYIGGIIIDITSRKKSEQELKRQRDLFELVINSVPSRIFWKDLDLVYLGCNSHFAKDSGMENPEAVIGKDDYDLVWKEEADIYRSDDKQVIDTGKPKLMYEEPFLNKEGEKIWWLTNKIPLKDFDGKTIGVIATSENITERKTAEEERKRLEMQLQQAKRMESIGQLAGGIAHDFNNILYPIIGFTQLSQNDLPEQHPIQENLQDILNGAIRAKDLVKRILLFSRQKEHQLKTEILQPVIKESHKLLRSSIPANIDLVLDLYNGEDFILCDATEIHEIILNLCTNSYHAITENDGKITISLKKQNPSPGMDIPAGEYLRLSVKDNGVGIPEKIRDRIFEPYVTTKDIGKGSGLGLSVVYGIVESYNGMIDVESDPFQGTEFIIFLPISKESPEGKEPSEDKTFVVQGNEHILFVDDEESIIKLGTRALEKCGYHVTATKDSNEAFELVKSNPGAFDLVITDMAMPGMVGSELSKKILEIRPDIQIIICSGYSERLEKEKLKDLKVTTFLDKPLSIDVLTKITRELLDKKKLNNV